MTKEEAIRILNYIPTIGEQVNAIYMVIEALPADRPTDNTTTVSANDVIDSINDTIKSADRPHGEWKVDEKHIEEIYTHPVVCSECGQDVVIEWGEFTPYCPNCGARMRGAE